MLVCYIGSRAGFIREVKLRSWISGQVAGKPAWASMRCLAVCSHRRGRKRKASIAAVVLTTMVAVVEMPVMAAAVMPTVVPIWPATTEQQQP